MIRAFLSIAACLLVGCGDGNLDFSKDKGDNRDNQNIFYQFQPEPGEGSQAPEEVSTDSSQNPVCSGVMDVDGADGFLWKPVSESDGNLVVLFPREFEAVFLEVQVFTSGGQSESGRFTGFANGNRQHWRFSMPGSSYDGTVVATSLNGECVWTVSNPSGRQD